MARQLDQHDDADDGGDDDALAIFGEGAGIGADLLALFSAPDSVAASAPLHTDWVPPSASGLVAADNDHTSNGSSVGTVAQVDARQGSGSFSALAAPSTLHSEHARRERSSSELSSLPTLWTGAHVDASRLPGRGDADEDDWDTARESLALDHLRRANLSADIANLFDLPVKPLASRVSAGAEWLAPTRHGLDN